MTETTVKTATLIFEMTPCGRCGGSGRYSYNQRHGSVCYGCSGKGEHLSSRGKRAADALDEALRASAGTVEVADLKPGMIIKSQAHGGVINGNQPWDYKPAWRRVAEVKIIERTGRGAVKGLIVDVPCVLAEIKFEGGKTWTAESSDDPAYWAKGVARTIYSIRSFWVGGEEARAARMEVRRDIARRFVGAWLEGEEPPAPAERKPRLRKSADMEPKPQPKPEPRTFPNRYAGDCVRPGCGQRVEADKGECFKDGGKYVTQHKAGECPEPSAAEEPQEAPAPAEDVKPARPAMANRWPGKCHNCGIRVLEGKGERVNVEGQWITRHKAGDCVEDTTVKVTEEGMYRVPGGEELWEGVFRVMRSEHGSLYAERFVPPVEEDGGATFEYDPAAVYALAPEHRMTVEDAAEIGRRLHVCSQCGERLTNPKSVARGIGPVCRKKV
ncbi:DUF6011 domain-containing protein [Streptomyces mirabilis]|uniref:DUF6011 domain-containing protein n=1 Tax=Streptomyces mirabilis TaxID=68239 RepID=UPI0036A1169E